jgi:hypothetical protein
LSSEWRVLLELLVLTGLKHSFDDGPSTATCRSWWADGIDEVLLWSRHRHLSFVSSLPNDSRTFLGSENGRTFLETGQAVVHIPATCRVPVVYFVAALQPALDQVEVNPVLADRSTLPCWHQLIELKCQRSRLSRKMGASIPTSDTSRSRSARAAAHVRKRELKNCFRARRIGFESRHAQTRTLSRQWIAPHNYEICWARTKACCRRWATS